MVTELQQTIYDEIAKYADLETARENAEKIADKCGCSDTYVRRMISRKENEGTEVHFKITPKSEESEESEEEISEDAEDYEDLEDEDEEPESLEAPDWDFDIDEEPEPEPEQEPKQKVKTLSLDQLISKENAGILLAVPFRLASTFTGFEGWLLTDEEQKRLSPFFRAILVKYLPVWLELYGAELIFAVVVIEVVGIKAQSYREWLAEKDKTRKAQKKAEEAERLRKEREEQAAAEAAEQLEPEESEKPTITKDSTQPSWMDGRSIG